MYVDFFDVIFLHILADSKNAQCSHRRFELAITHFVVSKTMTRREKEKQILFYLFKKIHQPFLQWIEMLAISNILSYQSIVHVTILNCWTNLSRHNGSALCLSRSFCRCIRHKFAFFLPPKIFAFSDAYYPFSVCTRSLFCVVAFFACCFQYRWRNALSVCLLLIDSVATFIQCISQFYHTIIYQCTLHLRSSWLPYTALVLIESCPIVNFASSL